MPRAIQQSSLSHFLKEKDKTKETVKLCAHSAFGTTLGLEGDGAVYVIQELKVQGLRGLCEWRVRVEAVYFVFCWFAMMSN